MVVVVDWFIDWLIIDANVMRNGKTHKKNLVIGWIDQRKAYNGVAYSWFEEVMGMMEIADNMKTFMLDGMQRWKTRLEYGGQQLGEERIRLGVFQEDSLSPLMFVMTLTNDLHTAENETVICT